ncbi:MAG: hydroxyacylglutathione hydrolase [Solirubrobacterales bacterium]|jgi:rhodanese-related sulfurtransferase/glyoxylase-like metal-dependent hydrolase (beta-lactamase superfamily II)|nr:hydroxyacylglutathione hydrolase [Solirubrobacterales bacterium]
MLFRQVIHEDLGCASYLVGDVDEGVAAVIDPQWDIEPYLHLSRLHGVRIEHVLETHTHADHVSGHGRLARATGATIHINRLADAEYPHEAFDDGWVLRLGEVEIEAVQTAGHRPEHTSFVLRDGGTGAEPVAVLSGDSLFVGDVARPDLAVEPTDGARDLYRSLHERLFSLPDEVEVWPGHLGGSLCGSSGIDHRTSSTIGFERAHNHAASFETADAFVADAIASIGERPPNVEHVVDLNRGPLVEDLGAPAPLTPRAVEVAIAGGALLVDARTNDQFDEAHIPGAISASAYDTGFGTKVAQIVPPDVEVIVVAASDGYELAAAELLASVGLRVRGFLAGGMTAWRSEGRQVSRVEQIDPDDLARRLDGGEEITVLDVRNAREFAAGHIPGSIHIPYGELAERFAELPNGDPIAAVCSGGKRSGLAASILQREGYGQVIHVGKGGVGTWKRAGHPIESSV